MQAMRGDPWEPPLGHLDVTTRMGPHQSQPSVEGAFVGGLVMQPHVAMFAHLPDEAVEDTMRQVLNGNLSVNVFNKNIELEMKKLALNEHTRRISIHREDGLCQDSWKMDDLSCITQGISKSILKREPPPPDRSNTFRFTIGNEGKEERFLCLVFDSPRASQLATESFRRLCDVPIYLGEK